MLKKTVSVHLLAAFILTICFIFSPPVARTQAAASAKAIAHRGYATSGVAPNSLRAFKNAGKESYYWGIESDVSSTSDGKLIMFHGSKLDEMENERVSIKKSDANYGKSINSLTYDTVKNYKLLDYNGKETTDKMPTFSSYLKACKDSGKTAIIEVKHVQAKYYDKLIKEIKDAGMSKKCVLIGSSTVLAAVNKKSGGSGLTKMAIMRSAPTDEDINYLIANGIGGIDFQETVATEEAVKKAKDNKLKVGIWTVKRSTVDACASAIATGKVDYITGNSASLIKQAISKSKAATPESSKSNKTSGSKTSGSKSGGSSSGSSGGPGGIGMSESAMKTSKNARGMAQKFFNLMLNVFYIIGFLFLVIGAGHFFIGAATGNTESRNKGLFMMMAGIVLLFVPWTISSLNVMDIA